LEDWRFCKTSNARKLELKRGKRRDLKELLLVAKESGGEEVQFECNVNGGQARRHHLSFKVCRGGEDEEDKAEYSGKMRKECGEIYGLSRERK